jgi:hypothetical protein
MQMTRRNNGHLLFHAGMNIFLHHILCFTQEQHRKAADSYRLRKTNVLHEVLRCYKVLVQAIQKIVNHTSKDEMMMMMLIYGLAMADRLQECTTWTDISIRCGESPNGLKGSWSAGWCLARDSATFFAKA